MLTREDWTKGTGAHPVIKGLIWFADGSRMKEGPGLESMGIQWEEGSASPWAGMQQFSRPRYMPPWPVPMKFNFRIDQKNTLVFALIVKRP